MEGGEQINLETISKHRSPRHWLGAISMDLQRGNGRTNLVTSDDRQEAWWKLFILSKCPGFS